MSIARSSSLAVSLLALGLPALALAHTGMGHGFMQGVAHPLGGMDHLLAMIAVGLVAGRAGGAALWQIPASFIAMMACGTLIGMATIVLPFTEAGIALSIAVFGLMLTWNRNPSLVLTTVAVGFFALFHGHAHGTEAAGNVSGLAYAAGLLSVSALLHACGAMVAVLLMRTHQTSVLRLSGGVLAIAGAGMFAGPF
jgi:urease accessory protein